MNRTKVECNRVDEIADTRRLRVFWKLKDEPQQYAEFYDWDQAIEEFRQQVQAMVWEPDAEYVEMTDWLGRRRAIYQI